MKRRDEKAIVAGLTIQDLERLTRDLDRPFVIDEARPLTPEMRAAWERAKRKRGRPRIGQGSTVISVSIERDLLRRADNLAKRLKITRARLIAAGLERAIATAAATSARHARKAPRRRVKRAA
jgi:hypothetical protein